MLHRMAVCKMRSADLTMVVAQTSVGQSRNPSLSWSNFIDPSFCSPTSASTSRRAHPVQSTYHAGSSHHLPRRLTTKWNDSFYKGLAPRNGYLPLLVDTIRPHFLSALPPGSDTIWFDYLGLPLKWHLPTGVLYDLLCAEPERPWKLTVHFRAFPFELLANCENEEAVKWKFINAMKEAAYLMYGNTKSVMNMSQMDQYELWKSVVKGDLENFDHISSRLRLATNSGRPPLRHATSGEPESEIKAISRLGSEAFLPLRIPIRLYIRRLGGNTDLDDLYDVPAVDSWDDVLYMTRPIHFPKDKGFMLTLRDALMKIVPHLFPPPPENSVQERITEETLPETPQGDEGHLSVRRSYSDVIKGKAGAEGAEGPDGTSTSSSTGDSHVGLEPKHEGEITAEAQELEGDSRPALGELSEGLDTSHKHQEGATSGSPTVSTTEQFNGFIRIQGIQPNLDIPLEWVAKNLCAPDQFLHICICTCANPLLVT